MGRIWRGVGGGAAADPFHGLPLPRIDSDIPECTLPSPNAGFIWGRDGGRAGHSFRGKFKKSDFNSSLPFLYSLLISLPSSFSLLAFHSFLVSHYLSPIPFTPVPSPKLFLFCSAEQILTNLPACLSCVLCRAPRRSVGDKKSTTKNPSRSSSFLKNEYYLGPEKKEADACHNVVHADPPLQIQRDELMNGFFL